MAEHEIEIPTRECPWCGEVECGPAAHAYSACGECGRYSSPEEHTEDARDLVEARLELLLEVVERPIEDENDFITLALSGEELRRALALADGGSAHARRAVARYEDALFAARHLAPQSVEADLERAFDSLAGVLSHRGVLSIEDEDVLAGPDEVLMVAVAEVRVAMLADSAAIAMGRRARARAAELAPVLPGCWQLAEDRSHTFGSDPELPGMYDWLDELGALAPSRLDIELALRSER